jgi:hypothetical protein
MASTHASRQALFTERLRFMRVSISFTLLLRLIHKCSRRHEFDRAPPLGTDRAFHLPRFHTAEVVVSPKAKLSANEFAERHTEIGRDLLVYL